MEFFFQPRGIAVIGASDKPGKGGYDLVYNLLNGYDGKIYPVNPSYREIQGLTCYPGLAEVPDPVDLAIIMVPNQRVLGVVEACAARGIKGAMIQAGGFAETGEEGREVQDALAAAAREKGIRLWGPNCMGLVDTKARHVFSFVDRAIWASGLPSSEVSLIVQSGMLSGVFLIDIASHGEQGVSKVCSLGNKVDVDECDVLEYLLGDDQTQVIGMYLESLPRGRRLVELCRGAAKPLVILKGGQSAQGARAAASHTASLAADHSLIHSLLAQAGVYEAHDFKQMLDICHTLARYPAPPAHRPGRVGIATYTGAAGIVSADFMDGLALELAKISPETVTALQTVYPAWMAPDNPCDIYPAVIASGGVRTYNVTVEALAADPGVDAILLHAFTGGFDLKPDLAQLAKAADQAEKPLVIWVQGTRPAVDEFRQECQALGLPVFRELYRAVECLNALFARPQARPARSDAAKALLPVVELTKGHKGVLDEHLAKQVLAAAGVPVVAEAVVPTAEKAVYQAFELGLPVVLKGLDPGLVHKTEAGLVKLGLSSGEMVQKAFADLTGRMGPAGRVLVQRQVPVALELIVGAIRDASFGPTVMLGYGGVLAEVLGRAQFAMAPLSPEEATDLIDRLPSQRLLNGFRGAPKVDRAALARLLVQVGDLMAAHPRLQEIDINPLVLTPEGLLAVDATLILS